MDSYGFSYFVTHSGCMWFDTHLFEHLVNPNRYAKVCRGWRGSALRLGALLLGLGLAMKLRLLL